MNEDQRKSKAFDWLVKSGAVVAYNDNHCWLRWPCNSYAQYAIFYSPLEAIESAMKDGLGPKW